MATDKQQVHLKVATDNKQVPRVSLYEACGAAAKLMLELHHLYGRGSTMSACLIERCPFDVTLRLCSLLQIQAT